MIGHQVALPGEVDGQLGPDAGRVDDPAAVRVIAYQFPCRRQRRLARRDPGAVLGEQCVQAISFGVGLLGQPAEVDRQALGAAHQRGKRRAAKRRVRVAVRRRVLQVRDQPAVRRQSGLDRIRRTGGEASREAAGGAEQGFRHRRADLVQRADRAVDGVRPGRDVVLAGGLPLGRWRVVPVVAGQIQFGDVADRVAPVEFQVHIRHPESFLERRHLCLVVRVRIPVPAGPGRGELVQPGADASRRDILRFAVVLVAAAELTHVCDTQVTDGAQTRGKVHKPRRYMTFTDYSCAVGRLRRGALNALPRP